MALDQRNEEMELFRVSFKSETQEDETYTKWNRPNILINSCGNSIRTSHSSASKETEYE